MTGTQRFLQLPKNASAVQCDTAAIQRNLAFGRKYKITGTPTLFFVDGTRVPGAADAAQIEKLLSGTKG